MNLDCTTIDIPPLGSLREIGYKVIPKESLILDGNCSDTQQLHYARVFGNAFERMIVVIYWNRGSTDLDTSCTMNATVHGPLSKPISKFSKTWQFFYVGKIVCAFPNSYICN